MYSLILAVAMQPSTHHDFPDVRIEDARAFCIDRHAVRAVFTMASGHANRMRDEVRTWNSPQVAEQWENETQWRYRCWYLLDDVIHCDHLSRWQKLKALSELRAKLGDEAYFTGKMPDPFPNYKR